MNGECLVCRVWVSWSTVYIWDWTLVNKSESGEGVPGLPRSTTIRVSVGTGTDVGRREVG